MNQLELAEKIAREAHAGQFRRDGVTPYINHVEAVVSRCKTDEEKTIAWLHDVIEDCRPIYEEQIRELGCGIYQHVDLLTKRNVQSYKEFINEISCCDICSNVKIADILSNLADSPTNAQIRKYANALLVLLG